jgi:hypothetical protein
MPTITYPGFWSNGTNNLGSYSYSTSGGGTFDCTNDIHKLHGQNLAVQGSTPEEPLTIDSWSTRSENAIVRNGIEVVKTAQLINTVNGAKTAIRGRARIEFVFDDRLTAAQRLLVAGALMGVLVSVNTTEAPGEGKAYKVSSSNFYRLINGLFVPEAGVPA